MITVIPSEQRHQVDAGWLKSRWHFSFGDYHDPANVQFSALRVFNDDVVAPGKGFGMHPHRDMEIVSYVIDGALEHRDHLGHRGTIRAGEVQAMSAGRGILHQEMNPSADDPVHFLQLWLLPRNRGNTPRYEDRRFDPAARRNALLPVASPTDRAIPGTLTIDADATIHVAQLDAGRSVTHEQQPGRHAYLFVIDGRATLNGRPLESGDQARVSDETRLDIVAGDGGAHVMLLDLP